MPNTPPCPWDVTEALSIIAGLRHLDGATLPILHALQAHFGFVPADAVPLIAEALNLSRADVHGVISFYHDFRDHPAAPTHLRLCRGEACQAMGSEALAQNLLYSLGMGWGDTSADSTVTIDPVFCLGLCAVAPAALANEQPVGRLNAQVLADLAGIGGAQ